MPTRRTLLFDLSRQLTSQINEPKEISLLNVVSRYAQTLPGDDPPVSFRPYAVRLVNRGSRSIYLLDVTSGKTNGRVIVKERPCSGAHNSNGPQSEETLREYSALRSVYFALNCQTDEKLPYRVPRPLLAIPEHGLLCMEWCRGRTLRTLLRLAIAAPWAWQSIERTLMRCGGWLRAFASLDFSGDQFERMAHSETEPGRDAPYVYALIGRQGNDLQNGLVDGVARRLEFYHRSRQQSRILVDTLRNRCRSARIHETPLVPVHGKFTAQDIFITRDRISVVDFENAGLGAPFLDLAFLIYELFLVNRWNPAIGDHVAKRWRNALLSGYGEIDRAGLACFVVYFMVNSLKPGGGLAGALARRYASRWLARWVKNADS